MIRLGLIGYPLSHSLSPRLHAAAFQALGMDGEYQLYPIAPEDNPGLAELIRRLHNGELQGLNVTIPHKQNILPLMDELTPTAQAIGAVNTIYSKGGKLIGHNTDAGGFLKDLSEFLYDVAAVEVTSDDLSFQQGTSSPKRTYRRARILETSDSAAGMEKKALVLGSGGGARAVIYALLQEGWQVTIAALLVDQARALVKAFTGAASAGSAQVVPNERAALSRELGNIGLIVNASPVGMSPKVDDSPWPGGLPFPPQAAVYDLIYNPRETLLLRQAGAAGLRTACGIGMLVEQAALSFACWTGREPPRDVMLRAVEA